MSYDLNINVESTVNALKHIEDAIMTLEYQKIQIEKKIERLKEIFEAVKNGD